MIPTLRRAAPPSFVLIAASFLCAIAYFTAVICFGACAINPAFASNKLIKSYAIENSVYQLLTQSNLERRAGNNEKARDLLLQAASYDPTSYSADVHLNLAHCLKNLKLYESAISEANKAMKFDSSCSAAYYIIGQCYYETKRTDAALQSLRQFVKKSDDTVTKEQAKQFIKEVSAFKSVTEARRCMDAHNEREAVKLLVEGAANDPSSSSAAIHTALSFAYLQLGDSEKAIKEGERALEFDPHEKSAVYNMAIAYQDIAKFDESIIWLQRYLSMETDPSRRKNAETFMQLLQEDKRQIESTSSNLPDYFEQMEDKHGTAIWDKKRLPLKVFISSGKGVFGYRPQYRSHVIRSLDTWCLASGKKLRYEIIDDPSKADIKVGWSSGELTGSDKFDKRLKAGITRLKYGDANVIQDADVCIRTVNAFDADRLVENGECASTCLHEIGHALGLGHSTNLYDIMYFRSSSKQNGVPTRRDKATIARLYADFPTTDFTPQAGALAPVRFLPPPTFVPPKPPETRQLTPPLFIPPPLQMEKKLEPPMYIPPPLPSAGKTQSSDFAGDSSTTNQPKKSVDKNGDVPLFIPPPLQRGASSGASVGLKSNQTSQGTKKPKGNKPDRSAASAAKTPSAAKPAQGKSRPTAPAPPLFVPPPVR